MNDMTQSKADALLYFDWHRSGAAVRMVVLVSWI